MRRPTRIVAWGLGASVAAAALGALVYAPGPRRPSIPVETNHAEVNASREAPTVNTAPSESGAEPNESTSVHTEGGDGHAVEPRAARKRAPPDEATARERMRKTATEDVQETYSLLFEDLGLSPRETEDLTALLIEMNIEGIWNSYQRGRSISDQERADRIAAAIGNEKLQEFLALQKNLSAYWETAKIESWLRQRGVPITETQRDGVLEILAEVRFRYPFTRPPADLDSSSDEYIDHILSQTDEFDRHVVELAPSVLSPTQVVHLFNAYEAMSRDRLASVEMQKKRKAAGDPLFERAGWMTPGRWGPHALSSAGL